MASKGPTSKSPVQAFDDHPLSYPFSTSTSANSEPGPSHDPPILETSWFDEADSPPPSLCNASTPPSSVAPCSTPPCQSYTCPPKAAALLALGPPATAPFTAADWFSQFPSKLDTSDSLPQPLVFDGLSAHVLYDAASRPRPFATLFPSGPGQRHLLVFVRHFYCVACKAYLSALAAGLADAPARPTSVVVVGCGDPGLIRYYKAASGCAFPVYADPGRRLFRALGMRWSLSGGMRAPQYMAGISRRQWIVGSGKEMLAQDWGKMKLGGNILQVGGEFLIEDGEVVWCHRMQHMRDHAEVDVVKRVLEVKR